MAGQRKLYLIVDGEGDADRQMKAAHARGDRETATHLLRAMLRRAPMAEALDGLRVHSLPRVGPPVGPEMPVVIGLAPASADLAERLLDLARPSPANGFRNSILGITAGIDLPAQPADCWCPGAGNAGLFGTLAQAKALIGAGSLPRTAAGRGVNIVVIDQGVDRAFIPPANWGGGWPLDQGLAGDGPGPAEPGTAPFGHGTKMALAALHLAPEARIWDLPLLPSHIHGLGTFLSTAHAAFMALIRHIEANPEERWVLCNAWSVYSLAGDGRDAASGNYGQNPQHPLNRLLAGLTAADIVFAAGNCGLFCPDPRCASPQVGPGNSIYGVAALPNVITVGAVRTDGTWIGSSSQGPAPAAFTPPGGANPKPNLAAPSNFAYGTDGLSVPSDPNWRFTGSSTACALTAGAVAAIRSLPAFRAATQGEIIAGLSRAAKAVPADQAPGLCVGAGILGLAKYA